MTASTHSTTSACRHVERLQLGNRLLRRREVELKTGKSRSSIYKGVSDGTFPALVPFSGQVINYLLILYCGSPIRHLPFIASHHRLPYARLT